MVCAFRGLGFRVYAQINLSSFAGSLCRISWRLLKFKVQAGLLGFSLDGGLVQCGAISIITKVSQFKDLTGLSVQGFE